MKANRMYWYSWTLLMTEAITLCMEIPLRAENEGSEAQSLARAVSPEKLGALQIPTDLGKSKSLENPAQEVDIRALSDFRPHEDDAETKPLISPKFLASSTTSSSLKHFHGKNAWTHGTPRTLRHWTSKSYKLMKNWLKDVFSKVYSLVKRLGSNMIFRRKGPEPPESDIQSSKDAEKMIDDEEIWHDAQEDFDGPDSPARTDTSIPKEHVQDHAVVADKVVPSGKGHSDPRKRAVLNQLSLHTKMNLISYCAPIKTLMLPTSGVSRHQNKENSLVSKNKIANG
ncbi:hypothetical protein CROQUDRAFT_671410 [Cronartium quercuum f. sp. fusiforme G11]|uniref:Uncharacterized protein n=1 Tax=Cronartium quercuum f. sp. fusiforme G11 TaxID=708437 RepID=A0A9P6NI41_9BASI|nr:hypothetical protein CROQUDRAFT_671410 [Cronartium quercuum f. sp. fusiforme G11]